MTEYVYAPAHKYAAASSLAEGEVGAIHEVRFIESESAVIENGAVPPQNYVGSLAIHGDTDLTSATPADRGFFSAYPILFPTEGAFATVGLKGKEKIKFNSKSPEKVDSGNTYGTTGFFSYNFFYAGIILKEECLLKISVAAVA
jgi:N4-gp56 family major capsid protein